jgi:hypothetical protein
MTEPSNHAKRLLFYEQDENLHMFGRYIYRIYPQPLYSCLPTGHPILSEQDMAGKYEKIIGIDTRALACAAADAICSSSVPSISFFDTGAWNKLYLLAFDDGLQVVARIPYKKCRGVHSKLPSEVATLTFARYHCDIPCPRVLAWNSSETNPVGAPYILMENTSGTPPWVIWKREPEDRRLKILDNLAMLHARFARPLPCLHLGDIHFATDMITGTLDSLSLRDPALYRAGPFSPPRPSKGVLPGQQVALLAPSASLIGFWTEYIHRKCAAALARWGPVRETIIADGNDYAYLDERNYTLGEFLDVASDLQAILLLYNLPSDQRLLDPCLVTTDYAFRNIFIDPNTLEVTSFLDWDDVSLLPFLLCTRFPEDISWSWGAPPNSVWCRTGRFDFVPNEETPLPGEEYEGEMERLKYRTFYKERLSAYDERFSPTLWKIRGDALKIQDVVTHGWVGYLERSDWLAATREEYEACAQFGGRTSPQRGCCPHFEGESS